MRAVSFFGAVGLLTTGGTVVAAGRGTGAGVCGACAGESPIWGLAGGGAPPGRGGGRFVLTGGGSGLLGVADVGGGTLVVVGIFGLGGSGVETEGTLEPPSIGLGGRVMRTVSRLTSSSPEAPERGGREMRTVSFLGSSAWEGFVGSAIK